MQLVTLEAIAEGTMAQIYRGKLYCENDEKIDVVVKQIHSVYLSNPDIVAMFEIEARIAKLLKHPNIVRTYGLKRDEGQLALVMEFLAGKNLKQILDRSKAMQVPLPISFSVFTIQKICSALHYFHTLTKDNQSLSLIHRDISPQNIMVGYNGHIKLVDFGIAKVARLRGITRLGVLKGKLPYMSPEQANQQDLDAQTDVFSAGLVLYELLCGKPAYQLKNELDLLRAAKDGRLKPLEEVVPRSSSKIPEELQAIVAKATAVDKRKRYLTAEALSDALKAYLIKHNGFFAEKDISQMMQTFFNEEYQQEKEILQKNAISSNHRWPKFIEDSFSAINGMSNGWKKKKIEPEPKKMKTPSLQSEERRIIPPALAGGALMLTLAWMTFQVLPKPDEIRAAAKTPPLEQRSPSSLPHSDLQITRAPSSVEFNLIVDWRDSPRQTGELFTCKLTADADKCRPIVLAGSPPYTVILSLPKSENRAVFLKEDCLRLMPSAEYSEKDQTCSLKVDSPNEQWNLSLKAPQK